MGLGSGYGPVTALLVFAVCAAVAVGGAALLSWALVRVTAGPRQRHRDAERADAEQTVEWLRSMRPDKGGGRGA